MTTKIAPNPVPTPTVSEDAWQLKMLGVSLKTIDSHRSNLMEKLDIHKVSGLVRFAIRTGLVEP
jgi:hypothetical protein